MSIQFEDSYRALHSSLVIATDIDNSDHFDNLINMMMSWFPHLDQMNAEYEKLHTEFFEYRKKMDPVFKKEADEYQANTERMTREISPA